MFLAICDQTRAKGSALFRTEMVLISTELPTDRVDVTIKALVEFGAISIENNRVTVHASRARVDHLPASNRSNLPVSNRSVKRQVSVRSRARARVDTQQEEIGFGRSFAEVNRIAAVRAKILEECKAFFLDPRWDQEHKRRRIGRKLMAMCDDELMPDSVREEIREYMQTRAERQRELLKNESKGESDWH